MKKDEKEIEEFIPEDGEGNVMPQVARLKEKLKTAEVKAKEYLDSWQKAQADFVNMRKRDQAELAEAKAFGNRAIIKEILPVLDSFTAALEHAESGKERGSDVEPIYRQLLVVLEKEGLKEVGQKGEAFDPRVHEAIKTVETKDQARDHTVAEVLQKGYSFRDTIIRPAKVIVYSV